LVVVGNNLYASSTCLQKWDGALWRQDGPERLSRPALGSYAGTVVASVEFLVDGVLRTRVCTRHDGSWVPLGGPLASEVGEPECLTDVNGQLFVGGLMSAFNGIAVWTGESWQSLDSGVGPAQFPSSAPTVGAILGHDGGVFVGGDFIGAGGMVSWHIARWNPGTTSVAITDFQGTLDGGQVELSWRLSAAAIDRIAGIDVESSTSNVLYDVVTAYRLYPQERMVWRAPAPSGDRWYRLLVYEVDGTVSPSASVLVHVVPSSVVELVSTLERGSGELLIQYRLGGTRSGVIRIYSISGRLMAMFPAASSATDRELVWNRQDRAGARAARGVYFVELSCGTKSAIRKVPLLK